jgi:hypothetical protein
MTLDPAGDVTPPPRIAQARHYGNLVAPAVYSIFATCLIAAVYCGNGTLHSHYGDDVPPRITQARHYGNLVAPAVYSIFAIGVIVVVVLAYGPVAGEADRAEAITWFSATGTVKEASAGGGVVETVRGEHR